MSAEKAADLIARGEPVEKPWRDIGYHFGIELMNDQFEVMAGRMMTEPGAFCIQKGMNQRARYLLCG